MLKEEILIELQEYIDRYSDTIEFDICENISYAKSILCEEKQEVEIDDFIKNNRKPTFNQILFNFIDKKGVKDSDIYKKAGIDRRHFSKIRSNINYKIGKNTAIALALALELNKQEADKLLNAAGYFLSDSNTSDLIIRFCLEKKIYDINIVNQALDYFNMKPLSGVLE